jgi:hypothetical protein
VAIPAGPLLVVAGLPGLRGVDGRRGDRPAGGLPGPGPRPLELCSTLYPPANLKTDTYSYIDMNLYCLVGSHCEKKATNFAGFLWRAATSSANSPERPQVIRPHRLT